MATGDMGISYVSKRDVYDTFIEKLPATILLTISSVLLTGAMLTAGLSTTVFADGAHSAMVWERLFLNTTGVRSISHNDSYFAHFVL